jgi:hypothetical protein
MSPCVPLQGLRRALTPESRSSLTAEKILSVHQIHQNHQLRCLSFKQQRPRSLPVARGRRATNDLARPCHLEGHAEGRRVHGTETHRAVHVLTEGAVGESRAGSKREHTGKDHNAISGTPQCPGSVTAKTVHTCTYHMQRQLHLSYAAHAHAHAHAHAQAHEP